MACPALLIGGWAGELCGFELLVEALVHDMFLAHSPGYIRCLETRRPCDSEAIVKFAHAFQIVIDARTRAGWS